MLSFGKKLLSFISAVLMLFSSMEYYAYAERAPITIRKELTASDGKVFEVSVDFEVERNEDGTYGFPEDLELRVFELPAPEPDEDEPAEGGADTNAEAAVTEDTDLPETDADAEISDEGVKETEDLPDAFDAPADEEDVPADADAANEEGVPSDADAADEEVACAEVESEAEAVTEDSSAEVTVTEPAEEDITETEPVEEEAAEEVSADAEVTEDTAPAAEEIPADTAPEAEEIPAADAEQPAVEFEYTYEEYVEKAAEALEKEPDEFKTVHVFDISLYDPATDSEWLPEGAVKVSIRLLEDEFGEDDDVGVVHFLHNDDEDEQQAPYYDPYAASEKKETEVLDSTLNDDAVEFETDGFSVYVVVSHEGGEVVDNPRVEFHYIGADYTEDASNPGYYTSAPFVFVNRAGTNQITQIVKNGETLEMIANPRNKTTTTYTQTTDTAIDPLKTYYTYDSATDTYTPVASPDVSNIGTYYEKDTDEEFFYGWYTVRLDKDNTAWDDARSTWTGTITYTWPDPKKVDDEIPVSIVSTEADGVARVGKNVEWTVGATSGTAVLDANGTAHVYLVPLYADFYFVNFHMGNKEAEAGLRNNLLTRRLVVFGTSTSTTVRIGDIECPSPDPAHQIFAGWETVTVEGSTITTKRFYTTTDLDGNEIVKTVDVNGNEIASAGNGYFITVAKDENTQAVDLYPVFAEARWVYFNIGANGNGATYVPSAYRLTHDDGKGTAFENFPVTTRPGFDFKGWYANAAVVGSDIKNLDGAYDLTVTTGGSSVTTHYTQAIQLTDASGDFVAAVKGKVFYYDSDAANTESLVCADTLPSGKIKLFEITSDGKLYTYKDLDSLTVAAKWDPKVVDYTVVYWLQNANDDNYSLVSYETFHAIAGDLVKITSSGNNGRNLSIDAATGTTYDYSVTLQGNDPNASHYLEKIRFMHYKTYDGMDGNTNKGVEIAGNNSTIINVYYDRNVYTLRFDIGMFAKTDNNGTTINYTPMTQTDAVSYEGTVYGAMNGEYIELTKGSNGGWLYSDALKGTVYGLVGGKYVPLSPGDTTTTTFYKPQYKYTSTTNNGNGLYGVDSNGDYVALTPHSSTTNTYTANHTYTPTTATTGTQYGIVNGEYVAITYNTYYYRTTGDTYTQTNANSTSEPEQYGTFNGSINRVYYRNSRWRQTDSNSGQRYDGTRYLKGTPTDTSSQYTGTIYYVGSGTNGFTSSGTVTGTLYGRSGSNGSYTYFPLRVENYWAEGNGTEYDDTRYTRANNGTTDVTNDPSLDIAGLYYVDGNGGKVSVTAHPTTVWNYTLNGSDYTGTRYTRADNNNSTTYPETDTTHLVTRSGGLYYHDVDGTYGVSGAYIPIVEAGTETVVNTYIYNGVEYTGTRYMFSSYTGSLYKKETLSGTYHYYVSSVTNSMDGGGYSGFLTNNTQDVGTTNPFKPGEYTGMKSARITNSGRTYDGYVYYYDITAKYGEYILDKYPGSSSRKGNFSFVGWIPQPDSYYWATVKSSIKGFFETMSETLILTGNTPYPSYSNGNKIDLNPDECVAITVDEDNTISGEHGITQEFHCRYKNETGCNYLYRIYLADPESRAYSDEPDMKIVVTAGGGSSPSQQTSPSFFGYSLETKTVLSSDGTPQNPNNTNYGAYTITELTDAGVGGGMIMEFRFMPNEHSITFKTSTGNLFGSATTYYYGQSIVNANIYNDEAIANTPEGYSFAGWYENPDGIGNRFNFNSTMPDAEIILYAVYKPIEFLIKINPNGAEIDHIDHTGASYSGGVTPLNRSQITYTENGTPYVERPADSGYNQDQSNYFFADYNETVGEYAVSRSYVPISDTAATPYIAGGRSVYAYVNVQYLGGSVDGEWGVMYDLRDALYVDATYGMGQYKNNNSTAGETEIYTLYKFYHDLIEANYISSPGWWDCDGAKELSFEAWKSRFVEKNDDGGVQLYRKCNSKETWVFLGWYKDGESMPYNFSDPVKGPFTLTAHWRLDGGYRISYTPEYYLENGDLINGYMESWMDPPAGSATLTYTDGAKTTVYKQPTDLTRNNAPVTDNSLIFRGWRVVSVRNTYAEDGVTILGTEYIPLEDGVFYDPNDDFTVNVEFADSNNVIHMQAVYEETGSSYRRPHVTNLTIDANSGYLTAGSTPTNTVTDELDTDINLDWSGIGTVSLDASADQILFGNVQSSTAVHLYRYATTLETDALGQPLDGVFRPLATNYFAHQEKYFMLGFDDDPDEGDYAATYPADGIIAVTRNDNKTIYAVWEPMVYLNIVNNSDGDVTFGLSAADNTALQVINVKNGMYDRSPLSDYASVTVAQGETLKLAFPKGAEKDITISGTNTLGVGKALVWNSSVNVDDDTSYVTTTDGPDVTYAHGLCGEDHVLPTGEVKNTKPFSFTERLISNSEPVVVTFSTKYYQYAMILRDNWDGHGGGGGMQEFDYSLEDITPELVGENLVPKTQLLPNTSTRMAYDFLGWAYEPDATEPDFSASNGWIVPDLNREDGFFKESETTFNGDTYVRELYAVWKYREEAQHVYVYKNVPDPGDQNKEFSFTLNLYAVYTYGTGSSQGTEELLAQGTFTLKHGEFAELVSSVETGTGEIKTVITMYDADGNVRKRPGTDEDYVFTVSRTSSHPDPTHGTFNQTEHIWLTEETYEYYDTEMTRLSQVNNEKYLKLADNTDYTTNPLEDVVGNRVDWFTADAGGTVIFNNYRKTKDVTVEKEYVGIGSASVIFPFTAEYTVNNDGVMKTVDLGSFNVASDSPNTDALKEIPLGATLTVTEGEDINYDTTVRIGTGTPADGRTASFTVTDDTTIYYKNVLKSYPVRFIKVDQAGVAGRIEAFFNLSAPGYSLGTDLYARPSNGDVFYVSGGTNEPLYAGLTYTLRETWVQDGFEGLDGTVSISVSGADESHPFTVSDTKNVTVSYNSTLGTWDFMVKNQEIKEVSVIKKLSDPLITQRTFTFNYDYKFDSDGDSVKEDFEGSFNLTPVSGSQASKTFTVPVGATDLTVSEDTAKKYVNEDGDEVSIAQTYVTTAQYKSGSISETDEYEIGNVTSSNSDDIVTFTNTRRTVDITVKKIVKADVIDTTEEFALSFTVRHGEIPISGYTVYDGDPADTSDDLVTNSSGIALPVGATDPETPAFSLKHNDEKTIKIPVGASVLVKEKLTSAQAKYAAFMTMPGVKLKLKNGKADEATLIGPTTDKELRVYNIPSICKVTDDSGKLLWVRVEGDSTPTDLSDDIYIPAIYDTIKGAFLGLGSYYGLDGEDYQPLTDKTLPYQVQMLVDYQVPDNDVVTVPNEYRITFTTSDRNATDGYPFRSARPDGNTDYRAILTRHNTSTEAFCTINGAAGSGTRFTMSDLVVDGDGASLTARGGAITAYNSVVSIDNCIIRNFKAAEGGAVYTTGDSLTITGSVFDRCVSELPNNGNGGGAINTAATTVNIGTAKANTSDPYDTVFTNCSAKFQGGAVFHYGKDKTLTMNNCLFSGCTSRSGGGLEADVTTVNVTDCVFENCTAVKDGSGGNAGGLNCYYGTSGGNTNPAGSYVTVTRCIFRGCTATENGGGLQSLAQKTDLIDCTFEDGAGAAHNSGKNGGGAALLNNTSNISAATVKGCTFTNCKANNGGGIYSTAKSLTIENNGASEMKITGCSVTYSGGAINVGDGVATIKSGTISGNYADSTGKSNEALGGAVYVSKGTLNVEGGTISGNYAKATTNGALGGAITVAGGEASATISGGTISGNYARSTSKDAFGGALVVRNGASLTMSGGTVSENYARAETATYGTVSGAAIYRYAYGGAVAIVDNGIMTLTGGTISGNYAQHTTAPGQASGAGIFVGYNNTDKTKTGADAIKPGTLYISGSPSFGGGDIDDDGNFNATAGNLMTPEYSTAVGFGPETKNGTQTYTRARQDIYIAGYSGVTASSVNVTGNIGSGTGAIWVWAEESVHIHKDDQFALTNASGGSFSAFRNARPNADTGATSAALYGVKSTTNSTHVIWGTIGGVDIKFYKRDGDGNPLAGATFSFYTDAGCTSAKVQGALADGSPATDFVSDSGGVVFAHLPVGIYYMKEVGQPTGYRENINVYIVLAGSGYLTLPSPNDGELSGLVATDISGQTSKYVTDFGTDFGDYAIFRIEGGKAVTTPNIAKDGIVNYKETTRKVILRKVNETLEPLKGAKFDILRVDMSAYATNVTNPDDAENGIIWIGNLPIGTYYLHETNVPDGYKKLTGTNDNWYRITVTASGTSSPVRLDAAP